MVAELRKACSYPTLLPEYATAVAAAAAAAQDDGAESPRAAAAAAAAAVEAEKRRADLAAASGKLLLLRQLLPALHAGGHRVLLLSQSRKVSSTVWGTRIFIV